MGCRSLCRVGVQGPAGAPASPGAHLDAGIDAIHQPVEEAAVDVLGQRVPAVVALGRGERGWCLLMGGCQASSPRLGLVLLTWGTVRVVSTVSSRAFTVRVHSAFSSVLGSSPISSQISRSSVWGKGSARAEEGLRGCPLPLFPSLPPSLPWGSVMPQASIPLAWKLLLSWMLPSLSTTAVTCSSSVTSAGENPMTLMASWGRTQQLRGWGGFQVFIFFAGGSCLAVGTCIAWKLAASSMPGRLELSLSRYP